MIVRVRSKDGMFRIELPSTADAAELAQKILGVTKNADPSTIMVSSQPGKDEVNIGTLVGRSLENLGLKHGDMIFVTYQSYDEYDSALAQQGQPPASLSAPSIPSAPTAKGENKRVWETVQEDPIDIYWRGKDGKVSRSRDLKFCKHGSNAMCDYCMPLEPYDAEFHKKENIKHLSFHAYLRKVQPPVTSQTSHYPPLTPESYSVKNPCPKGGHPPWPGGICSGCQPPAITLQPQPFRMVDHLEFASHDLVDRFIQAWRSTGHQRFGFMIGHYESYENVPMGIKAVVEAIHEPMQEGEVDGLVVPLPWEEEPRILELSRHCSPPLCVVGQIFTDLTPTEEDKTKLLYKRHPQSFFMSSLEVILAASLQSSHPTMTRSSSTGQFGSRFVTAIVSGAKEGGVDISSFQISEQGCAIVAADMIEATIVPGAMRVKEESREPGHSRYVPDVFYREKNEYGLDVKHSAKPTFPVEYLLVNVSHGFPNQESPLFRSPRPFPIENRIGLEHQTTDVVLRELGRLDASLVLDSRHGGGFVERQRRTALAEWLSDWHLLAYWPQIGFLDEGDIVQLATIATSPDLEADNILDSLLVSDGWQTLMTIIKDSRPSQPSNPPPGGSVPTAIGDDEIPEELLRAIEAEERGAGIGVRADSPPAGGGEGDTKECPHCTYMNVAGATDCDVCGLPM